MPSSGRPRPTLRLLVLVVVGLLAAACSGAETSSGPAATVGDTEISAADFEDTFSQRTESSGIASELAADESGAIEQNLRAGVLTDLIRTEVLRQAAAEQDIEVTDAQVTEQRSELVEQLGGEEQLQTLVEQNNLSDEELDTNLRNQVIQDEIARSLADEVSDAEVRQAFEEDAQGQYGEQVEVRHILTEARAEARDAIQRIESGEDFAEVAQDVSTDTGSAQNGGDLGEIPRGATVPEFEEAAFGAEPGEIVGPVESQFGFHVIEVTDRIPAPELADVSDQIREELQATAGAEAFTTYISEFVSELDVTVDEQYGTWNDEQVAVVPPSQGSEAPGAAPSALPVPTELPTAVPTG